MIFVLRLLGLEVLHIELAQPEAEPDGDYPRDLSGGLTYSTPISMTWTRGDGMGDRPEYDD